MIEILAINLSNKLQQFLQQIVMFLQEFDESISSNNMAKKKIAKKEYSAGFKNYHPQKYAHQQQSITNTSAQSDLFDQLKIGNLRQLYNKTLPIVNNKKEIIQTQQKSIQRLITKPQKKKEQTQQEVSKDSHLQNSNKLFTEVYHKVEDYSRNANCSLFKSQFKKIQESLKERFQQRFKTGDFMNSLFKFLLSCHQNISDQTLTSDQLLLEYTNFLNKNQNKLQKIQSKVITKIQMEAFIRKNLYLYGRFNLNSFSNEEIKMQNFSELIRPQAQFESISKDQHLLKLLNKKYTIPYQSQLFKESKASIVDQLNKNIEENHQEKFIFTANPVPKTTYEKPKERPQSSQKPKTDVQPFKLTDCSKTKKTMEDYYCWERNFHARQVPKTTYESFQIFKLNQSEKKERMKTLLQSASYPENMKYLKDYKKIKEDKDKELQQKYAKNHHMQTTNQVIPNFQQLHRHQINQLENKKVLNRRTTVPQPFNLSQPKQKIQRDQIPKTENRTNEQQQEKLNIRKNTQKKPQPASTLKFDAYVNFRKANKQTKLQQRQKQKKQQEKNKAQKNIYKDILKQRISHQLHNIPKTHFNPQPISNNTVKVNLQKIYNVEPLLIQRQSNKGKIPEKQVKKSWDPII